MTADERPDRRLDKRLKGGRKERELKRDLEGKLVVLKFDGTFQQGFQILLEIGEEGDRPSVELAGSLPPDLEISAYLSEWQQHYRNLSANSRIQPQQIIYGGSINRLEDCWQSAAALHLQMSRWLASASFRHLDLRLRESLSLDDSIRVLLRTQDPLLRRLPWHLWDFVERYAKTEIALSAPISERVEVKPLAARRDRVKILAVLGNSEEIDVQTDRQFLAALPGTEVSFLVEPSRQAIDRQLWEQPWDILFFAGHSSTEDGRGLVYINPSESLSLEELKYGLKQAIAKGLQLAIFNSCDGLGLARSLESLHLPQMIVMREPVPDRVAHAFLKYFLTAFSSGQSLYLSVRAAREQLQSIEDCFPCATWLPVICQNSSIVPPTWRSLRGDGHINGASNRYIEANSTAARLLPATTRSVWTPYATPRQLAKRLAQYCSNGWASCSDRFARQIRQVQILVLIGIAITIGLMSPAITNAAQPLELGVYDYMMQHRPNEGTDFRLLIVEITDDDIEAQKKNGELLKRRSQSAQSYNQVFKTSLSDQSLGHLLDKLDRYQPRVIGLDLYRDFAAAPDQSQLISRLKNNSALTAVCKAEDFEDPSIASIDPPPEVPLSRVGFSDFREDSDGILRRHLLGMLPLVRTQASRCNTDWSFSLQVAAQYLRQQQVELKFTEAGDLLLDSRLVEVLGPGGSSYPPDAGGSEILLNYRSTDEIAPVVTLQQFLSQQTNPDYLTDKIVLIGVTAKGGEDYWLTPISPNEAVPGVIVQAHMVSQLLSAALDNRPLLTTLSIWQKAGWILTWAIVGGVMSFLRRQRKHSARFIPRLTLTRWALTLVAATAFLYGLCFLSLLRGYWLPFISLVLALLSSSVLVTIYLLTQPIRSASSTPVQSSTEGS